jgi:uncharacterized protein YndB with AHSA1/START domain
MNALAHMLERTVLIRARRETVFRYFTDSGRFAAWWGEGSTINARPGGTLRIRYPNGVVATGEVREVLPDERIVFTYGYEDPAQPIPPGGSVVTVMLHERPEGTLVHLRHDIADAATRDHHVQGWRYQLAVFANVVSREQHAGAAAAADRLLAVWSEPDATRRDAELASIATPQIVFRDAFSCTSGIGDLAAHLAAAQMHMPGMTLERHGEVRQCQGTALVDWIAKGPDGVPRGRGTNVLELAPDGKIERVVGIWAP